MSRLLFFIVFCSVFLLSGCADNDTVAPVVNGWYQKNAASNYYVVRSGDTIYSIAFAFGLDYRALAVANNMYPPYPLRTGQRLKMTNIPAGVAPIMQKRRTVLPNHPVRTIKSP